MSGRGPPAGTPGPWQGSAVKIGLALLVVMGAVALARLPVQLFPDISRPTIQIDTQWDAASPEEIESELVQPQEEALQGLPGLREMSAIATRGSAAITLRFTLETDIDEALVKVIERLNRLRTLPLDAQPPAIQFSDNLILALFVQTLPDNPRPVEHAQRYLEDVVRPRLARVEGIGGVRIWAGAPDELQVVVDLQRAAALGVSLSEVARLVGANRDLSAGFVDVGRRQYTIRFGGRAAPAALEDQVLEWREGRPVRLGDVATVSVARGDRYYTSVQNGNPALLIQLFQQPGANVLRTIAGARSVVEALNAGELQSRGLRIGISFDAGTFITRAVALVGSSLVVGTLLAVFVVAGFTGSWRATAVIVSVIPVCLLATLVALKLSGRSLNVMSIAGLALAMGLVLDAGIIAFESILQRRESGRGWDDAIRTGVRRVTGALIAATVTTVVVFFPVLFMEEVEGQLFADLALTISIAVLVSLAVALLVVPVVTRAWMRGAEHGAVATGAWAARARRIAGLSSTPRRRALVIGSILLLAVSVPTLFMPRLDYFPSVRRDAVDAFFELPPGASLEYLERELMAPLVERLRPYLEGEAEPAVKDYYIWLDPRFAGMAVRTRDQDDVGRLEDLVRDRITRNLPDTPTFVMRASIFRTFGGDDRQVDLHLQSSSMDTLTRVAARGIDLIRARFPGITVQPVPGLLIAEPTLELRPAHDRMAELGFSRAELGAAAQVIGDGLFLGHYFDGDHRLNVTLRSRPWATPEDLTYLPLVSPAGPIVPFGDAFELRRRVGPASLLRVNGRRTLTLRVFPGDDVSLDEVVETLRDPIGRTLETEMAGEGNVVLGISADNLRRAFGSMARISALALCVLFILLWGLLGSVRDTLLVVTTVPLSALGSLLAIKLLGAITVQQLDLLTLFGFVIAMGLVVNNAILLVHQTRQGERDGLARDAAVDQALAVRLRPILMSTLTNVAGMLPLALFPGPGSAIYRGLAWTVVGGLLVSGVFTLLLLPSLLRMKPRTAVVPRVVAVTAPRGGRIGGPGPAERADAR